MGEKELIKITTNEEGKQLVSARELYIGLGYNISSGNFTHWVEQQLDNTLAIENEDYTKVVFKNERQILHDYIITMDIAKEICMIVGAQPRVNIEVKKKSKEFRRYFIECEKQLKEVIKETKPALTKEQELQLAIFNATTKEEAIIASADLDRYRKEQISLVEQEKDKLIHTDKTYTATELAKELKFKSAVEFNKELHERGIQYKVNGNWVLYTEYADLGYTELKQKELDNGTIAYYTRWTGKGRNWLINEIFRDVRGVKGRRPKKREVAK